MQETYRLQNCPGVSTLEMCLSRGISKDKEPRDSKYSPKTIFFFISLFKKTPFTSYKKEEHFCHFLTIFAKNENAIDSFSALVNLKIQSGLTLELCSNRLLVECFGEVRWDIFQISYPSKFFCWKV